MGQQPNNIELLDSAIGANGPSMGLGVPVMVIGIITLFGGIGMASVAGILAGIGLLLFAAYLILSIDCIAYDPQQRKLWLYKNYFITKTGKWIALNDYDAVTIYFEIDRPVNRRQSFNEIQLKTFSVYLTSGKIEKLLVKEFGEPEPAKALQQLLAKKTGLKLDEHPVREMEPKGAVEKFINKNFNQ